MKKILKNLTKRTILAFLALIVIGIPLIYLTILNSKSASAAWFNEDWLYRKSIAVTNNTTAQNNVYISITLNTSDTTRFKTNCGDLRFTKQNGELLPYYIVSGCSGASTVIHVNFDVFPAGDQTIYYYYGNPAAPNGFLAQDFSTVASNYTVGSLGSEEQSNGPVAYWKFDEGQGTVTHDSTTNKNDGNLGIGSSAPSWQTEDQCISGKCLGFNGDYINTGHGNSTKIVGDITLEAWINPNSTGGTAQTVIHKDTSYSLVIRTSDLFVSWADSSSWSFAAFGYNNIGLVANKWQHIAVTKTGSTVKIYLNGQLKLTKTFGSAISSNTNDVIIGAYQDILSATGFQNYFAGFIDDVKIYNLVRTAAQIGQDFQSRSGASSNQGSGTVMGATSQQFLSNGLVGYWKMNEASGNLTDSSGNSNTGTVTGTTVVDGQFGNGRSFNGSTDFAAISSNSIFNFGTNSISYSTWGNLTSVQTAESYIIDRTTDTNPFINLYVNNNRTVSCRTRGTGSGGATLTLAQSTQAITTGTWYFFTCVLDRTAGKLYTYVNGSLWASADNLTDSIDLSSAQIKIGTHQLGGTLSWTGSLDDLRIYNRALSPREVSDLYNWAPGPIAYWNLDDGTGTTAYDGSGNGLNLTLGNGTAAYMPKWVNAKYGKGLSFDGVNDYLAATDNTLFKPQYSMTLETWVYLNQLPSVQGEDTILVDKQHSSSPWQSYQWFIQNSDNTVSFQWIKSGPTYYNLFTKTPLVVGKWYHLAISVRNGTSMKAYINGVDDTNTADIPSGALLNSNSILSIGAVDNTLKRLNGLMDEVKLYNYARSQKQIVSDMNAGHPAVGSPVGSAVGYWKFDEGQGTTANNAGNGGSALNGTLTNMATVPSTTTSGWTNSGKFGKALLFDGIDDSITLANSVGLRPSSTISVSAWVNKTTTAGFTQVFTTTSSPSGYQLGYSNDTPYFALEIGASWVGTPATATAPSTGAWHHIVGIYDGNNITTYVDGKKYESVTASGSISYLSDSFKIGGHTSSQFFTGSIDEVKVYSYALTPDEIKTEYSRGSSMVLGALSDNSSYQPNAANQEYCVPGDTTSCAAPVGEWKMEEGSGQTTADTSGNGNTGTLGVNTSVGSDDPTWVTGKIGKALNFDGISDYVSVGNTSTLNISGRITISAWMKAASWPTVGNYATIAEKGFSPPDANQESYMIRFENPSGTQLLRCGTNLGYTMWTPQTLSLNTWYHLECVYDGTNWNLYVNGILTSQTADATGARSTVRTFNIGASDISGTISRFFNGQIDQVKIFNYARTPAQVAWDYNRGGPVGWWKFDECQGTIAHDSSLNGLNGTITPASLGQTAVGTCTTNANTMWWNGATGKRNASLNFDGSDDLVNIGNPAGGILDFPTGFTLSAWIKTTSGAGLIVMGKDDNVIGRSYSMFITSRKQGCSWNGASTLETSTFDLTTGVWRHLVCTYQFVTSGTSKVRIYRDGALDVSSDTADGPTPAVQALFQIGARTYVGAQNWFNGQIDDVRIYNYPLTATQVKTLYNDGAIRFGPVTGSP